MTEETPKPDLEVCVRLMDRWFIYTNNEQGTIEMPKYHIQIKDEGGYWSCGRSIQEAIDGLLRSHSERFPNGYGNIYFLGTLSR